MRNCIILSLIHIYGLICAASVLEYAQVAAVDICDPVAFCAQSQPGDYAIDPEDCNKYYVCLYTGNTTSPAPSDKPLSCESGQYFDGTQCVPQSQTCVNMCSNRDCETVCASDGSLVAIPGNCTAFFLCSSAGDIYVECSPENPYFDGAQCVNDSLKCCDLCTPYCEIQYTEVMDPDNCYHYFICLYPGPYIPSFADRYKCPDGEYFNQVVGHCEPEGVNKCEPFCPSFLPQQKIAFKLSQK